MQIPRTKAVAVSGAAVLLLSAAVLSAPAAASAIPEQSHCGTEPGNNYDAYVNHAQLTKQLQQIERTTGGTVDVEVAGYSNQGREIYQARVGHGDTVLLVESRSTATRTTAPRRCSTCSAMGRQHPEAHALRENITIVAVPRLNVDGGENDTRQNEMSWVDVVDDFPQLAGASPAWNYRADVPGFDVNRDFNPDLDYVPRPRTSRATAPTPAGTSRRSRRPCATSTAASKRVRHRRLLRRPAQPMVLLCRRRARARMSPLSISGRFIADPSEFGDWPKFDYDASRRANVAVYDALQDKGNSGFGSLTLYPQDTNLPGTALGSFALRGSATVLFETSSNTQTDGQKRNGMLTKQVEIGVDGLVDAIVDGSVDTLDPRTTRRSRPGSISRPTETGPSARRLTGCRVVPDARIALGPGPDWTNPAGSGAGCVGRSKRVPGFHRAGGSARRRPPVQEWPLGGQS